MFWPLPSLRATASELAKNLPSLPSHEAAKPSSQPSRITGTIAQDMAFQVSQSLSVDHEEQSQSFWGIGAIHKALKTFRHKSLANAEANRPRVRGRRSRSQPGHPA